jgi:ribosome recycling factor
MSDSTFEKAVSRFAEELNRLRANRATPTILETVRVEAYGTMMSMQEVASINAPEPQMLVVQPWDKSLIKAIETAIRKSDVGIQPVVDGEVIRLPFPPLTEEKRRDLVKLMREKEEDARIAVRKVREETLKALKQREKDGEISEDEYFRLEKETQGAVEHHNNRIKDMAEKKEKELMTV